MFCFFPAKPYSRLSPDPAVRSAQWLPELHAFLPLRSQLCCRSPDSSPPGAAQRHHLLRGRQHGVRQLHEPGLDFEKPLIASGLNDPQLPALRPGSGLHAIFAKATGSPGPVRPPKLPHLAGIGKIQAAREHHILLSGW